jgi:hypothetical protein
MKINIKRDYRAIVNNTVIFLLIKLKMTGNSRNPRFTVKQMKDYNNRSLKIRKD